jgi:DHA1 family tetracycline resistance protein-like MFS transporter
MQGDGPSLLMRRDEQGGLAGLIGATNGLTFVVAPTLSTALYGLRPQLPIVVGALVVAVVAGFVFLHPRFRTVAEAAGAEPSVAAARGAEGDQA